MALESWLMGICEADDAQVEHWLLKLLKDSNNVSVTAVVVGICNAYPEKVGTAGLAVLTCREFFAMDRARMVLESSAPSSLPGLMSTYNAKTKIHDDERRRADMLPHRKHDLEALTIKLQLGARRDAVWQILDGYRAALPKVGEQTEGDLLWRLALHRMDVRTYQPKLMEAMVGEDTFDGESPTAGADADRQKQWVYFVPSPVDADMRAMVDRHTPLQARQQADMALFNWGVASWRREGGNQINANAWREKLAEARRRAADGAAITDVVRGGPGFVAAVCVRDHWDEMESEERDWCVNMLIEEIERDCDSNNEFIQASRFSLDPSRPAAYILPKVLGENAPNTPHERVMGAIAKSLTHAVEEVIAYAAEGVGQFLQHNHRNFMLTCVGALARKARLAGELIASEKYLRYADRRQPADLERSVLPEVRALIAGGGVNIEDEVARLDLSEWPGQEVASAILAILFYCPDEPMAQDTYDRLARHLVGEWETARGHTNRRQRNYEFEYQWLERLARFVMRLPRAIALDMCDPLLNAMDEHPREVAPFVEKLVVIEDQSQEASPFWDIWQAFADRIHTEPWIHQLDSRYASDTELLRTLFFGLPWKDGVRHWRRLEGFADRVDILFESLPASAVVLDAYCCFLYTIGGQSLPHAFVVVAKQLQAGDAGQMLSKANAVFYLESLLRRFIYSQPLRLKSNAEVRSAVLTILDQLVDSGSSAAYRMRDDFVTPIAH
jgi:hypothetical protein